MVLFYTLQPPACSPLYQNASRHKRCHVFLHSANLFLLASATSFHGHSGSSSAISFVKTSGGFTPSSCFGRLGFGLYDALLSSPIRVGLPITTRTFKFDIVHPGKVLPMKELTQASAIDSAICFSRSSVVFLVLQLINVHLAFT